VAGQVLGGLGEMGRTIAIVEDEALLRENYADAMRGQGYVVDCYADRPLALEAFRARLPDLAIIDIGLGDEIEGGFDLCRELRSLSDTVPIIFLSIEGRRTFRRVDRAGLYRLKSP